MKKLLFIALLVVVSTMAQAQKTHIQNDCFWYTTEGDFAFHQSINMKSGIGQTNTGDQTVFTDETGMNIVVRRYNGSVTSSKEYVKRP